MTDNAELLLFVEVVASAYVLPACDKQIYASGGYWEQELKVLSVALGSDPGPKVQTRALRSFGIAEDVGDTALIGLRALDGYWFRMGAAEIDLASGAIPDREGESAGTIYNLPTTFSSFRAEAQATRADHQAKCGFAWPETSDADLRTTFYDVEECPDDPGPLADDGGGGGSDPTDDDL